MPLPTRIMVAIDLGPTSDHSLTYARDLAERFGATLTVVHVVDNLSAHTLLSVAVPEALENLTTLQGELETAAQEELNRRLPPDSTPRVERVVLTSAHPAEAILACADERHADLIVAGTHGRTGLPHFFLGSVAERLVRSARCAVLITRAPGLAPADGA